MNIATLETYVDDSRTERKLGCFPSPYGYFLPAMGSIPLVPQEKWREFEHQTTAKIKDQGSYGACNGHAAASSLEIARWISGLDHVDLSAWFVYSILCGGWDRGSSIAEALTLLKQQGTCTDVLVQHGVINPAYLTAAAKSDAERFKIEIGYALNGFDALMAATQLGKPFNFSISVNSGFDQLDSDGCPQNRVAINNHAVTGGLGAKRCKDGQWAIKCQNSWGTRWGLNGYFWIKSKNIGGSYFDAYTVEAVADDPQNEHPKAK